eukprot:SAG22_NODE_1414_length_4475_cov_10.897395_3_plen_178_part_00
MMDSGRDGQARNTTPISALPSRTSHIQQKYRTAYTTPSTPHRALSLSHAARGREERKTSSRLSLFSDKSHSCTSRISPRHLLPTVSRVRIMRPHVVGQDRRTRCCCCGCGCDQSCSAGRSCCRSVRSCCRLRACQCRGSVELKPRQTEGPFELSFPPHQTGLHYRTQTRSAAAGPVS